MEEALVGVVDENWSQGVSGDTLVLGADRGRSRRCAGNCRPQGMRIFPGSRTSICAKRGIGPVALADAVDAACLPGPTHVAPFACKAAQMAFWWLV